MEMQATYRKKLPHGKVNDYGTLGFILLVTLGALIDFLT
jgi:hypothetical protein